MNTSIVLTEEQNALVSKLLEFEASDARTFTISGWAGTGKTTTLREYVSQSRHSASKICVSAPTHKAKEEIVKSTGLMGKTLHSLLGLRPNLNLPDININNLQYDPFEMPKIDDYSVVLIDECSMINESLYILLENESKRTDCKVIFIGDPLQLPPVNESFSVTFKKANAIYSLKTIMRQKENNPIVELTQSIRFELIQASRESSLQSLKDYIRDITYPSSKSLMSQSKISAIVGEKYYTEYFGYEIITDSEVFTERIEQLFTHPMNKANKDNSFVKYTAWTNEKVNSFNKYIRNIIFDTPDFLNLGDSLFGYKTIIEDDSEVCINSKEYKVDLLTELYDSDLNIHTYSVKLSSINNNRLSHSYATIVAPVSYDSFLIHYNERLNKALKARNKTEWGNFYSFVNKYLLVEDIKNSYDGAYTGKPSVVTKTFGYAYGCTTHKLQGSTYDYIFVNVKDISRNKDIVERYKLLYVAISRARKAAFLYI